MWLWVLRNTRSLWAHYWLCRKSLAHRAAWHAAVYDVQHINRLSELRARGGARHSEPERW